ncbi:FecR domain-containing protein [Paraburkholderia sp. Ac-20347]|uniref:FecR domain-containing protein n=1 Tax=Paraburkholderia sp. Ac-20347 TaxID=2703892 RepID=UPI00197ECAAC|nr:FecR domain-containing protein [Paraburkholderia sp. Ac-20347]MBN3808337.1 DUF4880 domain-containing protein [Paraburkholderia sp. Ac-20347]
MTALKLLPGKQPLAKGEPISAATAEAAAAWLTVFMSGEATDADRAQWSAWRAANRQNNLAWEHIESIVGQLDVVKSKAAYQAVTSYRRGKAVDASTRRKVMQALALSGFVVGGAWLMARRDDGQDAATRYASGTGQRTIRLDDGSVVTLDADTAIAVDFDANRRIVRLQKGAIYVVTSHGSPQHADVRPFAVVSESGRVRALGTRFAVRVNAHRTLVAVEQSAVAITPLRNPQHEQVIHAGEEVDFTDRDIGVVKPADFKTFSWTRGQIAADDMRLDAFVGELNRYRPGFVRCMPNVASLLISGDFPVSDTDRILDSLPHVLPVKILRLTRYWTVVASR